MWGLGEEISLQAPFSDREPLVALVLKQLPLQMSCGPMDSQQAKVSGRPLSLSSLGTRTLICTSFKHCFPMISIAGGCCNRGLYFKVVKYRKQYINNSPHTVEEGKMKLTRQGHEKAKHMQTKNPIFSN